LTKPPGLGFSLEIDVASFIPFGHETEESSFLGMFTGHRGGAKDSLKKMGFYFNAG